MKHSLREEAVSTTWMFTKVFDTDLVSAPWMGRDAEAWRSLEQTRLARVIARLASFSTGFFSKCLRTMEAARELTYEGEAFATRLLVTNDVASISSIAGESFRPLNKRISIDDAISEKWVRAFTRQGTIALVVATRRTTVGGVLVLPDTSADCPQGLHASIDQVERFVTPGVAMIAATQNGDIWVRLGNGMAFLRRRGHWQFFDLEVVRAVLLPHMPAPVLDALLRLAIDASFERRGALFGVLNDSSTIREVVPDTKSSARSNRGLRELIAHLDITKELWRPVIRSAAMIDGAVLLTNDGLVLDAACIAVEPSAARRAELGIAKWPSFPGARSTAARNVSVYGVAIKISDDGPISVFVAGALRVEIG